MVPRAQRQPALLHDVVSFLQFQLSGESNSIKYDVTPQFFDCGMQPYDRVVDKEFFINNSGKVGPIQCWNVSNIT
jgi:hypothetical protein